MTDFAKARNDCRGDRGEINRPCHPGVLAGRGRASMAQPTSSALDARAGRWTSEFWGTWRDVCRAVPAMRPFPETTLGEMLADPIVRDLMAADGVDPSALRASLKELSSQLAGRRSADAES